tara:strand:- start:1951 stop:2580 length:630 start_codon:yes stop_codon:yes gene_type:complete
LRHRVAELESDFHHGDEATKQNRGADDEDIRAELISARISLQEGQTRQKNLEEEIAGLEAELTDDRELLDMAAQQGGVGVAEAIRRNKRLKAALRTREREIESYRNEISVTTRAKSESGAKLWVVCRYCRSPKDIRSAPAQAQKCNRRSRTCKWSELICFTGYEKARRKSQKRASDLLVSRPNTLIWSAHSPIKFATPIWAHLKACKNR